MRAIRLDGQSVELSDDGSWHLIEDAVNRGEVGFRGVPWGTSPEVAKSREGVAPSSESDTLLFWSGSRLGNLKCDVIYLYVNNILIRGKYLVDEEWVNENRYIDEYGVLKGLLTKKYGAPVKDDEFWSNYLWNGNYDDWGKAVEQGHLSMYASWSTDDSNIILFLSGENYNSFLGVEYVSVRLGGIEDELNESSVLSDL